MKGRMRNIENKRMMNTRQEQYREQVLDKLINETNVIHNEKIDWYHIELPFGKKRIDNTEEYKPTYKEQFVNHVTDNYGILFCEVDELWRQYTKYVTDLHTSLGKQNKPSTYNWC
jgi:hypothetical protein